MGFLVRFIQIVLIVLIYSKYLFASILFEKENIVITDIDLITYQNFNIDSNKKKLTTINQLKKFI